MLSKFNVMYVGFFTQQGAMADDYVLMGNYLAEKVSLYCLMGESDQRYDIPKADGILRTPISRKKISSLLDVSVYQEIKKFVYTNNIDIIFYKTPHPINVIISFIFRNIIQVEYCHDYKDHSGVNPLISIVSGIQRRIMAANTEKTFVASYSLKNAMLSYKKYWKESKISVIPLGIMDSLVARTKKAFEDIDVLFGGRIEHYKGLNILAQAVADESWNVYVVGKGSNVTFVNKYVTDTELAEFISRSKIIVLPYLDGTGSQIIPTAMYCGKVVIATDVGSFGEYIQNDVDGIIIPPGDVGALKSAISDVLAKEELRMKLCKNAFVKAQREFINSKISDLYIRELSDLITMHN